MNGLTITHFPFEIPFIVEFAMVFCLADLCGFLILLLTRYTTEVRENKVPYHFNIYYDYCVFLRASQKYSGKSSFFRYHKSTISNLVTLIHSASRHRQTYFTLAVRRLKISTLEHFTRHFHSVPESRQGAPFLVMVKRNSTRRFDRSPTVWHPLLTRCQRIPFLYPNLNHRMNKAQFAMTIQIMQFSSTVLTTSPWSRSYY